MQSTALIWLSCPAATTTISRTGAWPWPRRTQLFHTRRDGSELNTEHKAHEFQAHPVGTEHNVGSVGTNVVRLLEIVFKR